MEDIAQLVRASDCGSEGRGFETHYPPPMGQMLKFDLFLFLLKARVPLVARLSA